MKDTSIHKTSTGKVFQMLDGWTKKPMPFVAARHNYTRKDLASLKVGQSMEFQPMYGNKNPVWSILVRLT